MSFTAISVLSFGIYIGLLSFVLVFAPDFLFALLGVPPAADYWVLIAGMLFFGLALYYVYAAVTEMTSFMKLTAVARCLVLPYLLILVLLDMAPAPILIFGLIDLLFALWTFLGLRRDALQGP
jgi:hypothetical protein